MTEHRASRWCAWGALGVLCLSLVACGTGETGATTGEGAGGNAVTDAGADADGAAKRIVITRSPYGNVAKTHNLLWDGDFEWCPSVPEQYGWMTLFDKHWSYTLPKIIIGYRCYSGVKCVELPPKGAVLGLGVAAQGHQIAATFRAAPSSGDCAEVTGIIVSEGAVDPSVQLVAVAASPDQNGWCSYEAISDERFAATHLFIENSSDASTIIDDAVIEPILGATARRLVGKPLSAARREQMKRVRRQVRKARQPRDPPPPKLYRAFREWIRAKR